MRNRVGLLVARIQCRLGLLQKPRKGSLGELGGLSAVAEDLVVECLLLRVGGVLGQLHRLDAGTHDSLRGCERSGVVPRCLPGELVRGDRALHHVERVRPSGHRPERLRRTLWRRCLTELGLVSGRLPSNSISHRSGEPGSGGSDI